MSSASGKIEDLSDIWQLKKRGKRDSDRHKELVKEAIKKNSKELISQYDVVTTDGNKKIKISLKFLDQYKFKYGKVNKNGGIGQGLGNSNPGDKYRIRKPSKPGQGPGNEEGDRTFEHEVSIDEVTKILLEELDLPWMEEKESSRIIVESEEFVSIEKKGIISNLDIKRSLIENLKRNAASGTPNVGEFKKEDLRFKTWDNETEYASNAAVYIMMDRSGSMGEDKSLAAKTFYFWMVQILRKRYNNIKLIFIAHDTSAFIVNQEQFFKISRGGGTQCSSAFYLAYNHIISNHSPKQWNNYVFEFSDGDNWGEDNLLCVEYVNKLLPLVSAIGYGEINIDDDIIKPWISEDRLLSNVLKGSVDDSKFISLQISSREQIFEALKQFFDAENISDS